MKIERYIIGNIQTNTYLAYDEESKEGILVDPAAYAEVISEKIKEEKIILKYIILTHGHGDHIGGVKQYAEEFKAKIIAHIDEKEMLNRSEFNLSREVEGMDISLEADIYVKDKDELKLGDKTLTCLHTPGHSHGGMCIYGEGVMFCGDTIFKHSIGRTDFYGGDYRTLINSIKDVIFNFPEDTVLLPGHMDISTIGDEKRGNPFV